MPKAGDFLFGAALLAAVTLLAGCGADTVALSSSLIKTRCGAAEIQIPVHLIGSNCAGAQGVLTFDSDRLDVLSVDLASDVGLYGCFVPSRIFPEAGTRTGAIRFAVLCTATLPDDFVPFFVRVRPLSPSVLNGWVEIGVALDASDCPMTLVPATIACEI